jgi:hypothetical protein
MIGLIISEVATGILNLYFLELIEIFTESCVGRN